MTVGQAHPTADGEMEAAAQQDARRLLSLAAECEAAGITRHCLVLRLSSVPAELRKPHHLRLARDALDPLLGASRAQRFILPNDDIAMVWRGPAEAQLSASQHAVTEMFADAAAAMPSVESLWRRLDLPMEAKALRSLGEPVGARPTAGRTAWQAARRVRAGGARGGAGTGGCRALRPPPRGLRSRPGRAVPGRVGGPLSIGGRDLLGAGGWAGGERGAMAVPTPGAHAGPAATRAAVGQ